MMVDKQVGSLEEIIAVASQLNQNLQSYYLKTISISNLLKGNEDEAIFQIEQLLAEREIITQQYDVIKQEYQQLVSLLSNHLTNPGEELQRIQADRKKLLGNIQKLDNENRQIIGKQYNDYKQRIQHVKDGKKMINAYHTGHSLEDGIYFDVKK